MQKKEDAVILSDINTYDDLTAAQSVIFSMLESFSLSKSVSACGLSERYYILLHDFQVVAEVTGAHPYLYILIQTKIEEKFGMDVYDSVKQILDDYFYALNHGAGKGGISKDVAFACLYYLVLCVYRAKDTDGVRRLLKQYAPHLQQDGNYPLLFELYERFCNLNHDSLRQLHFSNVIQRACNKKGITEINVALYAGYASAVCEIAQYCFYKKHIWKNGGGDFAPVQIPAEAELADTFLSNIDAKVNYSYTNADLDGDKIAIAISQIGEAVKFNPDYPKYHYLLASLKFYQAFYENNKITQEQVDEVVGMIELAKSKVNEANKDAESILNEYDKFMVIVKDCPVDTETWNTMQGFAYEAAKNSIIRAISPNGVQPLVYRHETKAPHVFISYSSASFKQVYCDLIELRRQGILCDYDNEMEGVDFHDDGADKQKWYSVVEEKIRQSSCVICYLSEDYLVSEAVLLELKFIERYNKPIIAVDLSGKRRVSSLFVKIAKQKKYENKITSELLYWFAKKFDDDINTIGRQVNPLDTTHIRRIKNRVYSICPEVVNALDGELCCRTGYATNHPMEDFGLCDKERNIYVIADGITRKDRSEYARYDGKSISAEISERFSNAFYEAMLQSSQNLQGVKDEEDRFKKALKEANMAVAPMVKAYVDEYAPQSGFFESPGCVCVLGAIFQDILFFASAGDCMGILIRNGKKIVFADKQTSYAFKIAKAEQNRELLEKSYVNNPDNPFGYGVINGNANALQYLDVSHIRLEFGDIIYFVSDGISDYIQYGDPEQYNKMQLNDVIDSAIEAKRTLGGADFAYDDISIIRVQWRNVLKEEELIRGECD